MLKCDSLSVKNVAAGYLWAVASASLSFTLLLETTAMIRSGGLEKFTASGILVGVHHLTIMTLLMFMIGSIFAFVTALIPFTTGIMVARRLKITHWMYFVAGAAMTAVAEIPLYMAIPNLGINVQEPEPTFLEKFWSMLPGFLVCGSIAGAVCWRCLRRSGK